MRGRAAPKKGKFARRNWFKYSALAQQRFDELGFSDDEEEDASAEEDQPLLGGQEEREEDGSERDGVTLPGQAEADSGDEHARGTQLLEDILAEAISSPPAHSLLKLEEDALEKEALDEAVEANLRDESMLKWWEKTNGLHTVLEWCTNYKKHPAGWGALLMIHGVPQVCGRMRHKVEANAIYSALFLSATVPTIMEPPPALAQCAPWHRRATDREYPDTGIQWECEIRARVFFYALTLSIALHLLAILLAMSFCNALNETARDADVFRMFARGQGYNLTRKVENAFRLGMVCDLIAMFAVLEYYLAWEIVAVFTCVMAYMYRVYTTTTALLFDNGSIVNYWREEKGGKADADDPYNLSVIVARIHQRAQLSKHEEFQAKFRRSKSFSEHAQGSALAGAMGSAKKRSHQAAALNATHEASRHQAGISVAWGVPGSFGGRR